MESMLCMLINSRKVFVTTENSFSAKYLSEVLSLNVKCNVKYYPSATTGLDYAGLLSIKDGNYNELQKCYILIFTCATVRAVHLELPVVFPIKFGYSNLTFIA